MELNCTDRMDNDEDGLTDCEDPECCFNEACSKSQLCQSYPDPQSILQMKTVLPEFASFFHRTKFLVEDGSLQKFASLQEFDPKRVSVIRGRVVTPRGEGLMGARVQYQSRRRSDIKKGITLTRDDGWFDFLVNGGGIVTLMFGKSPFPFQSRSIYVPWNQMVVMDEVKLAFTKKREGRLTKAVTACQEQTKLIKPIIKVVNDERDGIREIIDLEDSTTKLVHSSWKSSGYLPKIEMKLLDALPSTLLSVHYRITIEGKVFSKVLEPDQDMTVDFIWDGRNAYGQKVYGNSRAIISVGYKHKMCADIVWITQEISLHGFTPKSTDIGGWDLDIHNRYNPKDGIVYRGDGTAIDLKQKEKLVTVITGNFTETVIGPVAIATNSEGHMFVGDSGFIRRVGEFGRVTNLLKLNSSTTSHKYYITLDPMEEYVYVSDPVNIRILKVPVNLPAGISLQDNFEVAVGVGEICSPNHIDCGDGNMAVDAQLVYPKGMAFTKDGEMVFVDGSSLRMVSTEGIVSTLAGERKYQGDWKPSPCGSNIIAAEANFNWPTDIVISPLDETITLIDHGSVLQVTPDKRVVELFCGVDALNNPPKNLAYTNDGSLIIVDESNLIHKLEKNGSVTEIAGSLSFCKRSESGCLISDFDNVVTTASKAKFSHISDITVGPDGALLIADQKKHNIRSIFNFLPRLNLEEKYQVMSPDTGEMYIFTDTGVHQRTNGIFASASSSNLVFIYNSNNEVLEVQDANMNKIKMIRSKDKLISGPVASIVLSSGLEYFLKINKKGDLDQVRSPSGFVRQFHYKESSGLIAKKYLDGKMQYLYQYDTSGRLKEKVTPMGRTGRKGTSGPKTPNQLMSDKKLMSENALLRELYMSENELLKELYKINPVTSGHRLTMNSTLLHQYDWEYFVHTFSRSRSGYGSNVNGVGKKFIVNNIPAFTSELHPRSKTQSLWKADKKLMRVEHSYIPKRTLLIPEPWTGFSFVEQTYDKKRRPERWSWGDMKEILEYDQQGRIKTVKNCKSSKIEYVYPYEDAIYPDKYKTEIGDEYEIRRDNSGGIQQISTPLKFSHSFNVQARVGQYLLSYQPPWSLIPFHFIFGEDGVVTRIRSPGSEQYLVYEEEDFGSRSARTENMEVSEYSDKHGVKQRVLDDLSKTNLNTTYNIQANMIEMVQHAERDSILLSNVSFSCSKLQDLHQVDCSIDFDGKTNDYRMTYDLASHQITDINAFSFLRDQTGVTITNQKKKFELKQSLDRHGRINLEQLWLKRKLVFTKTYTYDCSGKITEIQEKLLSTTETTQYKYTNNGQLDTASTPRVNWIYSYDANSNIGNVNFGLGNSTFENEFGERVSMVSGFNKVTYEFNGNMLSRSGYMFHYNDLNQLIKITFKNQTPKEVIYDSQGRPVIIVEGDAMLYLVYTIVDKPWLLTHVYDRIKDVIKTFTYDTNDKLIAVEENNKLYAVITSPNGSPKKLLNENKGIFKETFRSPFGTEIDDTKEDFNMVIGFNGGVDLKFHSAGVVIIEGRPYDSILGQWMVPDVKQMLSLPDSPKDVHLYRFLSNDPINGKSPKTGYLDTLTEWLSFFNLDMKKMSRPILDPRQIRGLIVPSVKLPGTFGPKQEDDENDEDNLLEPTIQKHLTIHKDIRRPRMGRFFHTKSPLLGPNIVISNDGGRINTLPLDGAGNIEKTIAEIIDNSLLLENHGNYHETIYFLKNSHINEDKITDLKRHVAVTEQDLVPHGREICVKTFDTNLCVISGKEVWELSEWLSSDQNLSSSMRDVSRLVS